MHKSWDMIQQVVIDGLRGFKTSQTINFAVANGIPGSGHTTIVGANNSGKTTVLEALRALSAESDPSFTQGRRNVQAGDRVVLKITDDSGGVTSISTLPGSSESKRTVEGAKKADIRNVLVLPSRRTFEPYFGKSEYDRRSFANNIAVNTRRSGNVDSFAYRLFRAQRDITRFNAVLGRVITPVPVWSIDQHETSQYFIKIKKGLLTHTSEGAGEGFVSLLFIVDALYDSNPGDTIVIDEPELSLHPAIQRKLARLFFELSADRQIVLSTHSPYFADLGALQAGGLVNRVFQKDDHSCIAQLTAATAHQLITAFKDHNNPHALGLDAREIFFIQDKVVLVEGQEDVIFFGKLASDAAFKLDAEYFGWGVGGASKMGAVAASLKELGYEKIVGILDSDKHAVSTELQQRFPEYHFFCIAAQDVRTKSARAATSAVQGLFDDNNEKIRPEYEIDTKAKFAAANKYLGR